MPSEDEIVAVLESQGKRLTAAIDAGEPGQNLVFSVSGVTSFLVSKSLIKRRYVSPNNQGWFLRGRVPVGVRLVIASGTPKHFARWDSTPGDVTGDWSDDAMAALLRKIGRESAGEYRRRLLVKSARSYFGEHISREGYDDLCSWAVIHEATLQGLPMSRCNSMPWGNTLIESQRLTLEQAQWLHDWIHQWPSKAMVVTYELLRRA